MIKPKHQFYNSVIKRLLDIVISLVILLVSWPVYAVVALIVLVNLGSPVIFVHERPGRIDPKTGKEKLYKLYKFRSMTNETDENGVLLPSKDRITKFGRLLRSTSLDEIPEIWNILKGDMSFVGPRPWNKKALDYYTDKEHCRHAVRPGLTGLAQVNGRNVADWDKRIENDLYYVENVSLALDIKILIQTVQKVLKHSDIMDAGKKIAFWDYRKQQWEDGTVPMPDWAKTEMKHFDGVEK